MNIDSWILEIDKVTDEVSECFGNLNADQLNLKSSPDRWSIAQCLEHLIVVNRSYFPVLQSLHEGTYRKPWTARVGFIVDFLGNTVLKAVMPDRRKKTRTFTIWEPQASDLPGDIVKKFTDHQEELKKRIRESQDLLDQDTVISSPANRLIVYRLNKAFDIIVAHEKRHVEQAKAVLEGL